MNVKLINSKVNVFFIGFGDLTVQIKIEEIAKFRGLKVMAYPLGDDVSGLLSIENGIGTIGYNQSEAKVRRRFTIAHELGHYELHRDKSHLFVDKQFIYRSLDSSNTPANQMMEREANAFASAILMPTDLVRKAVDDIEIDFGSEDSINALAKLFDVSTTAMSMRISGLGML
jgi:Zn-dependent peptidase ImmA (M78 family)